VTWLKALTSLPLEQRYRIDLISDPAVRWQRASLGALRCFAADVVQLVQLEK
jgi:hypothetical protein